MIRLLLNEGLDWQSLKCLSSAGCSSLAPSRYEELKALALDLQIVLRRNSKVKIRVPRSAFKLQNQSWGLKK